MKNTSPNLWTADWATRRNLSYKYIPQCSSTNEVAKKSQNLDHFELIVTDQQTAGRGRGNNHWKSSAKDTLLSTWSLPSKIPDPVDSIRIGMIVYESLRTAWPQIEFGLKAPNDIYVKNQKLAGILIEIVPRAHQKCDLFIGLGLNVWSAPQLEQQETTFLSQHTQVTEPQWVYFCDLLFDKLRELSLSHPMPLLSPAEQNNVLSALNKFTATKYTDVFDDGGLQLANGTCYHWSEL